MKIAFISYTQHIADGFFSGMVKACIAKGHDVKRFYHHGATASDRDCVTPWGDFYLRDIHDFAPDHIVIFNGYAKETSGVVSYLSRKYSTIFCERGWLPQRSNVYLDRTSLGGRSSISYEYLQCNGVDQDTVNETIEKLRKDFYDVKSHPQYGEFILVPLQLDHDTSVVLDSPYIKTMQSLLQFVKYNFPNDKVLVTPHPLCKDISVPTGFFKIDHIPTIELAKTAKAIIGINSTVMIESLIHYKPILMLGRSVISGSCVTVQPDIAIKSPRIIFDKSCIPNTDEVNRVLYSLLQHQFNCANPPDHVVDKIVS